MHDPKNGYNDFIFLPMYAAIRLQALTTAFSMGPDRPGLISLGISLICAIRMVISIRHKVGRQIDGGKLMQEKVGDLFSGIFSSEISNTSPDFFCR